MSEVELVPLMPQQLDLSGKSPQQVSSEFYAVSSKTRERPCPVYNETFLQLTDDDTEVSLSDRELELDEPGDLSSPPWNERLGEGFLSPLPSSGRSASLAAQLRTERSGRDTPASVDSIPLEWDHDYDLSRGLESASRALREQQSEDGDLLQRPASSLSG